MNIKITVASTTAAYEAGDLIGAKNTLTDIWEYSNQTPILCNLTVRDLTKQNAAMTIVIFDADPTGTTFTDNAALDIADADLAKVIAVIPVAATDYVSFNDNSVATVRNLAIPLDAASGNDIYCAVVSGGAPAYVANELGLTFGFLR